MKSTVHMKKKAKTATKENEVGSTAEDDQAELEHLQATWCSPVYGFFKPEVKVVYDGKRKAHVFYCAAKKCKTTSYVKHYQDSKDHSATSNLKTHATKCFVEVIKAAFTGDSATVCDGSIFAAFACQGQQPISVSYCALTSDETRVRIALWCAESSRPMKIVRDCQFTMLILAGRPTTTIPSPTTVSRDIKAAFEACRSQIDNILWKHEGHVHFATDAWTLPNHRAMVAWTVHLHHEGNILVFLLDILEVPESHTGVTLVTAFHQMLLKHGLENKIMAINADNATSNDTQTDHLESLHNSFSHVNRVHCFNHTLNLAVKALLHPFSCKAEDDADSEQMPELMEVDEEDEDSE
ncbi:hypothetical protein H0H92_008924, partial [Tricholoma furcatifolium]